MRALRLHVRTLGGDAPNSVILVTAAGTAGNRLTPSHDLVPLVMVRAGRKLSPIVLRLAHLHSSLSVNPNLMIAQDAFRTRLALLQRVVPFDVAGVRQLLTSTIC